MPVSSRSSFSSFSSSRSSSSFSSFRASSSTTTIRPAALQTRPPSVGTVNTARSTATSNAITAANRNISQAHLVTAPVMTYHQTTVVHEYHSSGYGNPMFSCDLFHPFSPCSAWAPWSIWHHEVPQQAPVASNAAVASVGHDSYVPQQYGVQTGHNWGALLAFTLVTAAIVIGIVSLVRHFRNK